MRRLVVDTNVVVSALIGKGPSRQVLESILLNKAQLCLSESVFLEYADVMSRPKFARHDEFLRNANIVLRSMRTIASFVDPQLQLNVCVDRDDNKFLELAIAGGAGFLVTGNLKHFPPSPFQKVHIVSPARAASILKSRMNP